MARILFELSGFFFLPFIAYAAFLIWQNKHPGAARAILERRAVMVQTLIGIAIVVVALFAFGLSGEHRTGGYSPAIFKNGVLVPGRVE